MNKKITIAQWDELSSEQKYHLQTGHAPSEHEVIIFKRGTATITDMVVFMGNDIDAISNCNGDWHVYTELADDRDDTEYYHAVAEELVDALFECVKYKLGVVIKEQ